MEHIGVKFSSGYMEIAIDPDTKKLDVTANIKDTDLTGKVTLKPVKTAKENK